MNFWEKRQERTRHKRTEYFKEHPRFRWYKELLGAIERIGKGDFDVKVDSIHHPFDDLAKQINEMARQLGTMEQARQNFISDVSHEIQSPLTSIGGFAALLKSDSISDEQRVHYLDIIETESKRLSNMCANLLKLSVLESEITPITPGEYRLDKQIENVVLILEPQWLEKKLNPDINLARISFIGDEELLSQVWINLLHNAIKFTPEGGNLDVILTADKGKICCTVSDSGIGISREDQVHIFERFYKADKSRDRSLGGNGLGLSLVKRIVELHGGMMSLESELGKGTTFTVRLPFQ